MTVRILLGLVCICCWCVSIGAEEPAEPGQPQKPAKKVAAARGVAQLQAANRAALAERAAVNRKLIEAQKLVREATLELAAAEKAVADATSDEARDAAGKQRDAASQKLDEVRKAATKQRDEAIKVTQAALAARVGSNAVTERENVDPQDPVERFALLTSGGPLVIQAAITIDGQPFRVAREKLVDELLAAADKDKDGKATWDEALRNPRFTLGRVRVTNEQQRQAYIQNLDQNTDGQVDRGEVRQFLARYFQGPAFTLANQYGYAGGFSGIVRINGRYVAQGGGQADALKLLDTDNNGELDEKEIAAAPDRLKSRDADDNDLLLPNEINGSGRAAPARQALAVARQPQPQLTVMLGPTAQAEGLFAALQQHYKNEDDEIAAAAFAALPKLFELLDGNQDGKLQQDEVLGLNDTKPHIELEVDLATTGEAKGLTLLSLAPELAKVKESAEAITVELPGITISMSKNLTRPTGDYSRAGDAYLMRYDKDNNGYLDKNEMAGNLAQQFELWDGDEDGKVFAKEIVASYTRMQAPQLTQVRASAANQGNPLFQVLDQSGDGRLSLREMRTAGPRIKSFDENKDGLIAQGEIPVTLAVSFGLGNSASVVYRTVGGAVAGSNRPAAASDAPEWFTRMDRNGDGDVTLKEFLADEEEFKKLDTNNDGFIEPAEAKQAEAKRAETKQAEPKQAEPKQADAKQADAKQADESK